MTKRKFYKAIFQFTVLSEEPFTGEEMPEDLSESTSEGEDVGNFKMLEAQELDGEKAAKALLELGSEPAFFRLDKNGNDTEAVENDGENAEAEECDECGATIPSKAGGSIANKHHKDSCSLYDDQEE